MTRTEDLATEDELRELFSMDEGDPELGNMIATHDGEWRCEANNWPLRLWRFWRIEDDHWPHLPDLAKIEITGGGHAE